MSSFLSLVKVQFLAYFGINKFAHKKSNFGRSKLMGLGGMLLLITAVLVFFAYIYAKMFAEMFKETGDTASFLPLMLSLAAFIAFFFSFYAVSNVLFSAKNYEALSSLPVKTSTVVVSKFVFLYLSDLFYNAVIMIPSVIVYYTSFSLAVSFTDILLIFLMLFFTPLFPLAVSVIVGTLMTIISSRFKKKGAVQTILLFIVIIAIMVISFVKGNFIYVVKDIYFISPWFYEGITNALKALLFCGVSLGAAIIPVALVSVFYKKINTLLLSKRVNKKFKLKQSNFNGQFKALFVKELKRLISCPVYAVNCLMGALMGVIAAVAIVVLGQTITSAIGQYTSVIVMFLPALFAFLFMLAPSTACSISIEGSAFWIIRSSPVSYKKIMWAKLLVNIVFNASAALICAVAFSLTLKLSVLTAVFVTLTAVLLAFFAGTLGLVFNLLFPKMKWDNENAAVKQGLSVFLSIMTSMALAAILGVIGYFILGTSVDLFLGIIVGVLLILNVVLYIILIKKGEKLLNKIES